MMKLMSVGTKLVYTVCCGHSYCILKLLVVLPVISSDPPFLFYKRKHIQLNIRA